MADKCVRCGACCIAFDSVEIVYRDIKNRPASYYKATPATWGGKLRIVMRGLKRCPHLRGRNVTTCSIRANRPLACRIFPPTKENCEWARSVVAAKKKGIRPGQPGYPVMQEPDPAPPTKRAAPVKVCDAICTRCRIEDANVPELVLPSE